MLNTSNCLNFKPNYNRHYYRSITLCFRISSILSQQKSPTAEISRIYFLGTIVRRKYLPKISAVGLFCCDKFEEIPNQKVFDLSKFKKFNFSTTFYDFLFDRKMTSAIHLKETSTWVKRSRW